MKKNIFLCLTLTCFATLPLYSMKLSKPLLAGLFKNLTYRVEDTNVTKFFKKYIELHPTRSEQRKLYFEEIENTFSTTQKKDLLFLADKIGVRSLTHNIDLTKLFSKEEENLLTNINEFALTTVGSISYSTGIKNFALARQEPFIVFLSNEKQQRNVVDTLEHNFAHYKIEDVLKAFLFTNLNDVCDFGQSILNNKDNTLSIIENTTDFKLYNNTTQSLVPLFNQNSTSLSHDHDIYKASFSKNNQFIAFQVEYGTVNIYSVPRWKILKSILARHLADQFREKQGVIVHAKDGHIEN